MRPLLVAAAVSLVAAAVALLVLASGGESGQEPQAAAVKRLALRVERPENGASTRRPVLVVSGTVTAKSTVAVNGVEAAVVASQQSLIGSFGGWLTASDPENVMVVPETGLHAQRWKARVELERGTNNVEVVASQEGFPEARQTLTVTRAGADEGQPRGGADQRGGPDQRGGADQDSFKPVVSSLDGAQAAPTRHPRSRSPARGEGSGGPQGRGGGASEGATSGPESPQAGGSGDGGAPECTEPEVPSPEGTAAVPGVNGTIAFQRDYEIYAMKRDGSAVSQLTNSPSAGGFAGDFTPAFSPDGLKIAFSRFRDVHEDQIYAMDADGSDARRLTCMPNGATEPAFSPDGQKIAFVSETARNTRLGALSADWDLEIYLMDADGSGETQLTQKGGSEPAFSPDGLKIAFSSCRHDPRKREQGGLNDCPGMGIFRDGNSEIYVMDADGSERRLTHAAAADYDPAFSPDGQQIAFTSERDGNSEIYVMDADGSDVRRLTNHSAADTSPAWGP